MSLKDRSFVSAWGFISHTLVTLATAVSSSRIGFCCLFPASWHFSLPTINSSSCQRLTLLLLFLFLLSCLLLFAAVKGPLHWGPSVHDGHYEKYLQRVIDLEATDTDDPELNYGIVIDCGSSGSRVFVYYWPRHNGNPHDLLDIHQMRDGDRQPVVKKIKPGISTLAFTPEKASDYVRPLLSYATRFIPVKKHKETPLYILCTAGMRLLPERDNVVFGAPNVPFSAALIFYPNQAEDCERARAQRALQHRSDILPVRQRINDSLSSGVYAWIGINFVLGRFDHGETDDDAVVAVTVGGQNQMPLIRKRTVGIIDMGGASLQIAYEVPNSVTFTSPEQDYCATKWSALTQRFESRLFSSHADQHRLKRNCNSALVSPVCNRDLRQESLKSSHAMWPRFSFVYNHYLFFVCLAIVLLAIVLYVLRLRRIHRRHTASLDLLWIEGEPLKADEVRS
nr:PREDICTED: ectonucleoside triphosphate diphosphohydrolase 7 [Latimeria chalumnae]|eukprot:XP_014347397.1 PREDICTED: ectonucleoside triphosphate diphosphohydrolase 7 [Latimeria chalumnae]